MTRNTSIVIREAFPRALRVCIVVALASVVAVSLWGCGPRGGLSDRYVAEKMAWRAQKLRRAMAENPDVATEQMKQRVMSAYAEIVRLFPPPTGDGSNMSDVEDDVAVISGMSRLRLAGLYADAGDAEEAQRLYSSVVDSYAFSRSMAVEAATALAASYEGSGMVQEAADVLMQTAENWAPAATRDDPPDQRILRAPLLAATSLAAAGLEATPAALEGARDYYRRIGNEWSGTPTGRSALATIAESYELEGRWADAAGTYERLDEEYGTPETRPSLLLKLGDLYSGRMGDVPRATEYYEDVERLAPEGEEGATASIELARFDLAKHRYEQARRRLQSVLDRFADEKTLAATASQLLASSYEMEGRLDTAIARYGQLSAAYPTSLYGLAAPIHVAKLYATMGEDVASATALDRAVEQYERVIRDYADTPAEMAARSYLIAARSELEDWSDVAPLLVETALRQPQAQASAGMLLKAGDIYATKLGDPDTASDVFRRVVDTYGGSPAAEEAQRRLEQLTR